MKLLCHYNSLMADYDATGNADALKRARAIRDAMLAKQGY
jgi:hypothetical protein